MKNVFRLIFLLTSLFLVSCENDQVKQEAQSSLEIAQKNENSSNNDSCSPDLLDDYLNFKKKCQNDRKRRLDIGECDSLYYSLKAKISNGYVCDASWEGSTLSIKLSQEVLIADKKNYEDQYYHGSEGQLRCGVFVESEFQQYINLCPVSGFDSIAVAKKCFNKVKSIRERYPQLDCEARLEWYGALFSIFNINSSYENAKEYLTINDEGFIEKKESGPR